MDSIYSLVLTYKYLILFPLAVLEGPLLAMLGGFLIKAGYLSLIPTYIILVLGNVIPDTVYYGIGRFGHKKNFIEKYGAKFSFVRNHFPLMEKLWATHFRKTIFLSKLAYGLSTPFLISAGLVKIPFKKFISYTASIDLFDIAIFIALGFIFGQAYEKVSSYINDAGILVAILFLLFILLFRFITKRASVELTKLKD